MKWLIDGMLFLLLIIYLAGAHVAAYESFLVSKKMSEEMYLIRHELSVIKNRTDPNMKSMVIK